MKKRNVRILIDLPIDVCDNLRKQASNKTFKSRKNYIEYLCTRDSNNYTKKQLSLFEKK